MTNNTKNEMAVVYARFSSNRQQETSIEGQLSAARKYAAEKGYTIVREYCDRAKTGTNDNREEFQKMLSDCAKKQFSVIIVWKVDRFGRNREEITFNKYRAKKNGVRVEYVAENVTDGPEGVILESVLEGMAEYYSLQLSQNVRRGLLEAAKKHHVLGGTNVSYGYSPAQDKTYEINPKEATVVKLVFDMYAQGYSEFEIIRHLNSHGYRTRKGTEFKKNSLIAMLKNERYIGTYIYKDVIREENVIPAIIDPDIFRKVQEMLKVNRRTPSRKWSYTDYLLTGKLYCGKCATQMAGVSGTSRSGAKHNYYSCMKRWKEKACDKKNVRQDVIEPLVLDAVYNILDDPDMIQFIADKTWELYEKQDTQKAEVQALQDSLSEVEKGIRNLVKAVEAGIISETIQNRLDELEAQKTAIKKSLAEQELMKRFKLTKEVILFSLEKFRDLSRDDRKCQRRLIETFVNSIFLYDDKLTITFNYSGDNNTVTLSDIEKACSSDTLDVFERARSSCPEQAALEPIRIYWFKNVFAVDIKIPVGY